jgi:hypothetical protein
VRSFPESSESNIRALRDRHWTMLCLAVFIIAASFTLQIRDSSAVVIPWLHLELPTLCGSVALFGVECPGCGLTRSFIALAAGDLKQSYQYHHLGWLMALAVVAQIPYRAYSLWELRSRIVRRTWPVWFGNSLIAMLLINWLLKISNQ